MRQSLFCCDFMREDNENIIAPWEIGDVKDQCLKMQNVLVEWQEERQSAVVSL